MTTMLALPPVAQLPLPSDERWRAPHCRRDGQPRHGDFSRAIAASCQPIDRASSLVDARTRVSLRRALTHFSISFGMMDVSTLNYFISRRLIDESIE